MEYVIVQFAERREVLIDGVSQGYNMGPSGEYVLLTVDEGVHKFGLRGPENYVPSSQTVVIDGTSPINPLRVAFEKKGSPPGAADHPDCDEPT